MQQMENKYQVIVEEIKKYLKEKVLSNREVKELKEELLELLLKIENMEAK